MEELKPCPFCGNGASIRKSDAGDASAGYFYFIQCRQCKAKTGDRYASIGNDCPNFYAELREAWNTRPTGELTLLRAENEALRAALENVVGYAELCSPHPSQAVDEAKALLQDQPND